jgi:hypothetical protein
MAAKRHIAATDKQQVAVFAAQIDTLSVKDARWQGHWYQPVILPDTQWAALKQRWAITFRIRNQPNVGAASLYKRPQDLWLEVAET